MARARRLFWLGAFAGIVYLVWRWRQQAEFPDFSPPDPGASERPTAPSVASLSPRNPNPAALGGPELPSTAPRRIPTRVHRGAPPAAPLGGVPSAAVPDAPPDEPEPTAPPAATMIFRELAIGANAPANEIEPTPPAAEPPPPLMDLAPLVGADAGSESVDLGAMVSPMAEAGELLDLASLVGPAAEAGDIIGLTNLNSADVEALIALPGIGPAFARRIIAHREAHGPFASVEQLVDIPGIGTRNIDEFRHLVTV